MNELNLFQAPTGEPLARAAFVAKTDFLHSAREPFAHDVQEADQCTAALDDWVPKVAATDTKQHVAQDSESTYVAESAWIAEVADDATHVVNSAISHVTAATRKGKESTADPATKCHTHEARDMRDYREYMYDPAVHHHHHHYYGDIAAQTPAISRKSTSGICAIATAAVVGAVVVPLVISAVAPAVAGALGFTAKGIAAHSIAAGMMSTMGGALTQAGSLVATMQAIGATGAVALSPAIAAAGAVVGASVASAAAKASVLAINAAAAAGRGRVES